MKTKNLFMAVAILFGSLLGSAMAGPKNGFGLNGGYASYTRDCGGCAGSSTSGLSIGVDYQFALSDKWSISPFLMSSSETSPNVPGDTVGHGIFGAQLRYWVGDIFVGGHLGSYSEVIQRDNGTRISGTGGGTGLVAGWEKPDGGLYVMGQFDNATMDYGGSIRSIKLSAFRFSVGYRWK